VSGVTPAGRLMSRSTRPNILFITLDQFRADSMSCAGHRLVRTPNLDRLAAGGVRLARHYSQAAPCAPGRAALYTGMYQMNNRVVANGTPLDDRFDNVARAAARAGYVPTLFGYTDQSVDPRTVSPDDPRLGTYEGILPGFVSGLDLTGEHRLWLDWLAAKGHACTSALEAMQTEDRRPSELSVSSFLTDRLLDWIGVQSRPWFAHASYLRPHPPYRAAGRFASLYDPAACTGPLPVPADRHRLHESLLRNPQAAASGHAMSVPEIRAQYYGMISEVDANLGRIWDTLAGTGAWDDTVIVVTADHGEQLGDQGLLGKAGYFESSYHVPGIVRDPRRTGTHGSVVEAFTENVDIFPTLCDTMEIAVPLQCDGLPLTPFLDGTEPPIWRDAATYEWDWRDSFINAEPHRWPWDQRLERQQLTVRRNATHAYVQFGNGNWLCFALADDPTWQTYESDPSVVLQLAQDMLVWRATHTDRTLTGMLLEHGGIGRFPDPPHTVGRS
jgi:arylsulfatase A-like enzyme